MLGAGDIKMKSLGLCPEGPQAGDGHAIPQLQSSVRSALKGWIEDAMGGPLDLGVKCGKLLEAGISKLRPERGAGLSR